jgi:hypothetical protein
MVGAGLVMGADARPDGFDVTPGHHAVDEAIAAAAGEVVLGDYVF